jgi:phosphoserine phosphatase RsbU/P
MKKNIFAVDDDATLILILKSILEFENYNFESITEFQTIDDVIQKQNASNYDLFIIDYMLYNFTGIEVYKKISALPKNKSSKYILLTSVVLSPEIAKQLLEYDIQYVKKPFTRSSLMKTIRELLNTVEDETEDIF